MSQVSGKTAAASVPSETLAQYGLRPEDLKTLDIQSVAELGKGIVSLVPEKGQAGVATMALSNQYSLTLTFLDERKPYFVVKGTLISGEEKTVVLENTLYLEPDKPALLGVTNLRDALILVVRRLEDTPSSSASSPPRARRPRRTKVA